MRPESHHSNKDSIDCDRQEIGPRRRVNVTRGPNRTPVEEVAAMADATAERPKTALAIDYLKLVAADMRHIASLRVDYMRLARQYGVTNQQIGDALGITEAAVRALLKRHGDA